MDDRPREENPEIWFNPTTATMIQAMGNLHAQESDQIARSNRHVFLTPALLADLAPSQLADPCVKLLA